LTYNELLPAVREAGVALRRVQAPEEAGRVNICAYRRGDGALRREPGGRRVQAATEVVATRCISMSDSNAILNVGDLAKPANTLVEKISDAIGGLFKPYQIRRIAQAEADAEKMRAVAQIEITELQRRAMQRFIAEEAIKQNNMESITTKALCDLSEDAKPEQIENDWITNFFDKCRLISDDEMQALWARVLAGEANSPGNYSKRTINLLSDLDKSDAILFSKLCSFSIQIDDVYPLIYDVADEIYTKQGLTFAAMSHLDSLGLTHFNNLTGYGLKGIGKKGHVYYFNQPIEIEFQKEEGNEMSLGKVIFTKAGKELAPVCNAEPIEGFIEYLKKPWAKMGYKTGEAKETTPNTESSLDRE
jgi:uncharacterized protein DUF2806